MTTREELTKKSIVGGYQINDVTFSDVTCALRKGFADFAKAPLYGLFFGAIFAVGGIAIFVILSNYDAPWMILPIAIGFPLIGPFVAAGLYEVSRRLSAGEPISWRAILFKVFEQRERQFGWMAFVVLFVFWIWLYQVRLIFALFLGFGTPSSLEGFLNVVISTPEGIGFLLTGTLVGAALATILFVITVISMPLLLDSELDFVTAMITSVKTVVANPVTMLGWGIVVTLLTVLALLPGFLGLLIIFPILGHATWHLYRHALSKVPAAT